MITGVDMKNEEGFAIFEALVFLTVFILLAVYTIDFFTAIHTGVLGNIHARTYLFETLRHRSNIDSIRTNRTPDTNKTPAFAKDTMGHERFHAINDEDMPDTAAAIFPAVGRTLTQAEENPGHVSAGPLKFDGNYKASILYIKSGYGICTDAACAKDGG